MTLSLAQHKLLDEVRSPTCGTRCPARELAALHADNARLRREVDAWRDEALRLAKAAQNAEDE